MPISLKRTDGRLFRFWTRRKNSDNDNWIQIYKGWGLKFEIGIGGYFDNRVQLSFCFIWGKVYIDLPIYTKYDECEPPRYGFYYYENSFWFLWHRKIKCIHMPYDYDWVRTSNLKADGTWVHEIKGDRKDFYKNEWKDILWSESYPYTYILKSGDIQHRIATLRVVEMEWRQRWLKWTRFFSKRRRSINIDFDGEVGEKTGSWKGGCTGCGYDMRDGELPEQTLRRMEKERKF